MCRRVPFDDLVTPGFQCLDRLVDGALNWRVRVHHSVSADDTEGQLLRLDLSLDRIFILLSPGNPVDLGIRKPGLGLDDGLE